MISSRTSAEERSAKKKLPLPKGGGKNDIYKVKPARERMDLAFMFMARNNIVTDSQ